MLLFLPMFDAATEPVAAVQPDPPRAEPRRPVPPKIARVLSLVLRLTAYGKNLADTLQQHAAAPHLLPCFAFVANIFGTTDLALILARITRGLLRAAALEARLRQRARGPDLQSAPRRPPSKRKPRPAKLAAPPGQPAQDAYVPTPEEIVAKDRRRPIGAVLVDICLDLGIVPAQMGGELRCVIIGHGGSLARYLVRQDKQRADDPPTEARPNTPPPLAGGLSREADQCREADQWGEEAGSANSAPPPIAGLNIVFPPWPAQSLHAPSPMSAGSSQECTGPP
jgi:hypothetical protein